MKELKFIFYSSMKNVFTFTGLGLLNAEFVFYAVKYFLLCFTKKHFLLIFALTIGIDQAILAVLLFNKRTFANKWRD